MGNPTVIPLSIGVGIETSFRRDCDYGSYPYPFRASIVGIETSFRRDCDQFLLSRGIVSLVS